MRIVETTAQTVRAGDLGQQFEPLVARCIDQRRAKPCFTRSRVVVFPERVDVDGASKRRK
ncbi:MAG TPA: hypothetical protein VMG60_21985 [Burkholderiaceae bacterium]|nr:hypothetical protein [Burkholderiaceae bacterium]